MTFLVAIPFMGQATETNRLFKARHQTNLTRSVSTQLTHSDTIPLQNMSAIYALSIDATITQPREASFVRIVLEDTEGHDYLVAESDRFRNDTLTVQLSEYCEETARLDGVTPTRLKCYLSGDATLTITGIYASDQTPTRGEATSVETAASIKEAQVQDIVDRINNYNVRHGKLWRAGVSNSALIDYNSQIEFQGEQDAYMGNLKYYVVGIYDIGGINDNLSLQHRSSSYVSDFDWRNRHSRNWITSVKNQGGSGYCVAFAINGMLEARANLYFNRPLNLDLSEQDIVYNYARAGHKTISSIYTTGMSTSTALNDVVNNGVLDEDAVPFIDSTLYSIPPRPVGNECVQITSFSSQGFTDPDFVNQFKHILIHHGPVVSGFRAVVSGNIIQWHATTLVGYHTISAGDTIRPVKIPSEGGIFPPIVVPDNHPYIGQTYWVMKDSYGEDALGRQGGGYLYLYFTSYASMSSLNYTTSSIYSRNYSDNDIAVEDRDGDGYFNWGIGPRPNDRLPSWAEQEEDGDDSNRFKGAMNQYGYIADVNYSSSTIVINHSMTDTELIDSIGCSRFLRRHIRIDSGVTFTIQGSLAFYSGKRIYMNNLSNLVIDGGSLVDPTLYNSTAGGKVVIKNGGKIVCHKKSNFVLPDEITMEMQEGSIFE